MLYRSLLLSLFLPATFGSSVTQFISDYLKLQWKIKPQGGVHLFQCWSTESQWRFMKELSSSNIRSFTMENINIALEFNNLDTRRHNDILIDASCSGALQLLSDVENNSMFDDASLMVFKHVSSLLNISAQLIQIHSEVGLWNWELADINIGGAKMSKDLLDNAAYIPLAVFRTSTGFIFKQPSLSFMRNIFTLPFSNVLWMVTVILVAVMGLLLYLAFIWESETAHWSDIILLCLGTICLQGYSLEVRLIPSRIIMMMLLVVAVFLYASYSGSIVMLLQFSSNSIHTLDDLLHSGLTLTAEEFFRGHEAFNESNALRAAVGEDFYPLMDGLVSVTQRRVAFLVDVLEAYRTISETFEQEDKRGLKIVDLFPKGSLDRWITLKKNSELKEILTLGYLKVHELGLHRREIIKVFFKNPECVLNGLSFAPVGITDCYPVILAIPFGIALALIIFLLENAKARHFIKQKTIFQN